MFALPVGFGMFYALVVIAFNTGDGMFSNHNEPLASFAAFIAIIGILIYLSIGFLLYKSFRFMITTLLIIVASTILSLPIIEISTKIHDSYRNFFAEHNTDNYVSKLQSEFINNKSPFKFDFEESNKETLYYGDLNRLQFEKIDENTTLSTDEIDELLLSLPVNKKGFRVEFVFGKYYPEYKMKISGIAIFLDQNKNPTGCSNGVGTDYSLCEKYDDSK
ncbi:hypothetical protein [Paenibacillus monticola]|uniref:Uncharacterized protein n=1 Tax=Paenibacillus monticola TaxID=2666075 RepID=A0A7X2L5N5_9BACL|nr:hypothetical protein [Paenibacillus monticola]MRN56931.1 hypothetical protein [Paenibacillus monticola]